MRRNIVKANGSRPSYETGLLQRAGRAADRLPLATHPGVLACQRLGLDTQAVYRDD